MWSYLYLRESSPQEKIQMTLKILHPCPNCSMDVLIEHYTEKHNSSMKKYSLKECSFCNYREENQTVICDGKKWSSKDEIEEDLHEWFLKTHRANYQSTEEMFFIQNFKGSSKSELAEDILNKHKKVVSDFDVIDFLFFGVVHPTGSNKIKNTLLPSIPRICSDNERLKNNPIDNLSRDLQTYSEEDILIRVLYSVVLGDGKILESEQRALDSICGHWNKELPNSECRIWRPMELPIPKDPKRVLRFAIEVAVSDDEIDQTEWRIIEEFARFWSIDRKVLEEMKGKFWNPKPNKLHRIFTAIQNLFFRDDI